MSALRLEADEAHEKNEELKARVKTLEQENLEKEQEITSLTHRNQLLEGEVEKLESSAKEAKDAASQSAQHDTQNEALQRRVQLLEEEAEEADRNLRETNEKYVPLCSPLSFLGGAVKANYRTLPQAPPNRRQGWSLRTQGAGFRIISRRVGEQIRGNGKEARGIEERAPRTRGLLEQCLRIRLETSMRWKGCIQPVSQLFCCYYFAQQPIIL